MNRRIGLGGALVLGLSVLLAGPAQADTTDVLRPSDFDFSATRTGGHHQVVESGLRIWTDSNTSADKVAGYVATGTPLADVGDSSLEFTNTSGGAAPGYQLVVDLDGDGDTDGILVGETAYGGDWWLSGPWGGTDISGAPGAGHGYAHAGTLAAWEHAFEKAQVTAFGFSLGSGVKGDGVIEALTFAGTTYTVAADVELKNKNECKDGGWAISTVPEFRNQGACVSSFASSGKKADK